MIVTPTLFDQAEKVIWQSQRIICNALEGVESTRFQEEVWERAGVGNGKSYVLEHGSVFERATVSASVLHSVMPVDVLREAASHLHLELHDQPYYYAAVGISLIIHPYNPMVPTVHTNYRYFQLEGTDQPLVWWFSGGSDLTPFYLFEEDAVHFHHTYQEVCNRYDPHFYPRFKQSCDEYFFIPHRNEHRGIGGIRFTYLHDRDPDVLLSFVNNCAAAFIPAYLTIVNRRNTTPFTEANKRWQLIRRGRYVEFNLIYDRGTSFGFKSGVQMRLSSLPPIVCWEQHDQPNSNTEEARLLEVLQHPRTWV